MKSLLREQWGALRTWLDEADVLHHADDSSGLEGWTVRDLVVHLGFGLVMLDEVKAAPRDAEPLRIGQYVAGYRPAAHIIRDATRELAAATPDALEGIDVLAARAMAALDRPSPHIVQGRRGPLTHDDFVLTRLVELVVHGDDLTRVVRETTRSPLLPDAITTVAAALEGAYTLRSQELIDVNDPLHWIRIATGRWPSADPYLPLL